ncbi:MAG: HAMP domain-containing sensor histidine kinase [Candidatus Falkowbacteria bacterium]|nr:HAMP domain-containing sensor histidine kinase [Candidatus Falkowbacteria bacterium]
MEQLTLDLLDIFSSGLLVIVIITVAYHLYSRPNKKSKTDFVSLASHQLRTPLTIMKGYISMILEGQLGELKQTKIKAALSAVYQANERLIRLTDNFLEVSQLEDNAIHVNLQAFDFPSVVHETITEIKPKAAAKRLVLTAAMPRKKFLVKADELMMRQLLLNLLDNAIKYTKKGGITLKVELKNKLLKVSVIDTGPGLDEKDLKDLFDKFERRTKEESGFGLGLYVNRLIVEAHKGKIWAETRGKDFGFKVIFEIPV